MLRIITFVRLVWRIEMNNNTYAWNDLLRSMQEQHEMFKNAEPTLQQGLLNNIVVLTYLKQLNTLI